MIPLENLPTVNASLNATSALLLLAGYIAIRNKKITTHRNFMVAAFCTSTVFLACYLYYHFFHGASRVDASGVGLWLYYGILLTHTVLAVVIVPLIFITFYHAIRGNFESHMRIARWTLPMWFYVSVTGVIIYLLLYHWHGIIKPAG